MSVACHLTRDLHRLYHLVSFAAPSKIFSLMSQPKTVSVWKMEFLLRTSMLGHIPAQQSWKGPAATGSPHKLGVEHHRPLRLRGSQNLVQLPPPQPHHDGSPVLLHHLVLPSQQRQQLCPTRLPLQERRWRDAQAHPTSWIQTFWLAAACRAAAFSQSCKFAGSQQRGFFSSVATPGGRTFARLRQHTRIATLPTFPSGVIAAAVVPSPMSVPASIRIPDE